MKNFKRERHSDYRNIHEQTHGGKSVSGLNGQRTVNDLIQIIGDSETIPQVDPGILNITDKGELYYWISKSVVEDPGNIYVVTRANNFSL